jgi:PAS domain S-box-containing protein
MAGIGANVAEQIGIMVQRRRTQAALRDSERTYRMVAENLHEGIWFIDRDEVTTYVNPRMADMLGYTVDEMIGQRLFAYMDERGVELCERNLERRKQGIKEQHDFELLRKYGERIYTSMATTPVMDAAGNYIGALAGVADITDRKNIEKELEKAKVYLEKGVKDRTTETGRL